MVFVQDYHFALLPRMLKDARPDLVVMQFWHIPWPNREVFRICPWQEEILDGLLGNDLLSFHIQYHCNNFLETVDRALGGRGGPGALRGDAAAARPRCVRPQPISIDPDASPPSCPDDAGGGGAARCGSGCGCGDRPLLVGVDRVDYIKGIPERLRAVDRLLTLHPELKGRFCFVQVAAPSRIHIPTYRRAQRGAGGAGGGDQLAARRPRLAADRLPQRALRARRDLRRCTGWRRPAWSARCTTA